MFQSVFNHEQQKPKDPLNSKDISDSAFFSLKHKAYLDIEGVFVLVIPDMINIALPQNKGRAQVQVVEQYNICCKMEIDAKWP